MAAARPAPEKVQVEAYAKEYLAWVSGNVERLEQILGEPAAAAPDIQAQVSRANRIFHDLKGNGSTFGYDLVTAIARSGCDLTCQWTEFDAGLLLTLRNHARALGTVVRHEIAGDGGATGQRLLERLRIPVDSGDANACDGSADVEPHACDADLLKAQQLAQKFMAWTEDALGKLAEIVERGGGGDAAARQAHDILHNLKGSGVLFGYDLVTQIADSGCMLVRDETGIDPTRRAVLRRHVGAMQLVIDKRIAGDGGEAGHRLLAKLADLRTRTCGRG